MPPRKAQPDAPAVSDLPEGGYVEDLLVHDDNVAADPIVDPLATLLSNPAISELIDRAVAARMAQGSVAHPIANATSAAAEMGALAQTFEKLLMVQAMQMPGYFKPLAAEEVERRAAGQVEMRAILAQAEVAGTPPTYYVGPNRFYGGAILYEAGEPVATYLPPVEDFQPCYDGPAGRVGGPLAERVLAAMMQWLGGPSPGIAERVKEAEEFAHNPLGGVPLVGAMQAPVKRAVERLDVAPREIVQRAPFADMGETVMPGIHGLAVPQAKTGPRVGAEPPRGPAVVE